MECYHPLYRVTSALVSKSFYAGHMSVDTRDSLCRKMGKKEFSVFGHDEFMAYTREMATFQLLKKGTLNMRHNLRKRINDMAVNPYWCQRVPCGRCKACRLKKSREWANRCALEAEGYEFNYFLTLTYDDKHVPKGYDIDVDTGEVSHVNVLVKKDFQNFMKRLRERFKRLYGHDGIRFFGCGEYGNKNERPHFHVILFNCPFSHLKQLKMGSSGLYFTDEDIAAIWNKGFHTISPMSWANCAYTARYVMKKQVGKSRVRHLEALDSFSVDDLYPWQEEFILSSRRPGIGGRYFDEHTEDIFDTFSVTVKRNNGAVSVGLPLYYRRKIKDDERYKEFVQKQSPIQIARVKNVMERYNAIDYDEYLMIEQDLTSIFLSKNKRM